MYLKALEMTGFKSFPAAKMEFPLGITAIVGPNGAGKSNIVDAILWVLGEQSPKSSLRCEKMEDVIFNGTETRKPLGMAEVSLVLGGLDPKPGEPSLLPPEFGDYHEVMITRRLYRNGVSEYLINKVPCRLKDVRLLLMDTLAGTKGHTVIEQGQIEQVLSASPSERRELIEETAGIVRYKKQKAEALRKLEAASQNLHRIRDIIAEVRQRLSALERQAREAKTYQILQGEVRTLEIRLLAQEYRACKEQLQVIEAELAEQDKQEVLHAAEEGRLMAQLETLRVSLREHEAELTSFREEISRLEQEQAQALRMIEVARNRVELLEHQRVQLQTDRARLESGRARACADLEAQRNRLAQLEADEAAAMRVLEEQELTVQALANRRAATLAEAEHLRRSLLALSGPLEPGMANDTLPEVLGEALKVRLEGCLARRGQLDQQIVLAQQQRDASLQLVHQLDERVREAEQQLNQVRGRLAVVSSRLQALRGIVREEMGYGRDGDDKAVSLRTACEGIGEALAEQLEVPAGLERAVEALLGERLKAWLVAHPADARQAMQVIKQYQLGRGIFMPIAPRWSKRETDGWWSVVRGQPGVLGMAADLVKGAARTEALCAMLLDGVVVMESLEHALRLWEGAAWMAPDGPTFVTLEGDLLDAAGVVSGGTTGGLLERRRELQELERQQVELTCEIERLKQVSVRLASDREQLLVTVRQLELKMREAEQERLAVLREEREVREAGLGILDQRLRKVEEEYLAAKERLAATRVTLESLRARIEQCRGEVARIRRLQEEGAAQAQALTEQLDRLAASIAAHEAERSAQEGVLKQLGQRILEKRRELVQVQETHAQTLKRVGELEQALDMVRKTLAASRDQRTAVEVRRAEIRTQLTAIEGTLTGTYQVPVEEALALAGDSSPSAVELREELKKLRAQLERMGPINLASIEEHRELEERYRFLTTQERDLTQSVQSLKDIITKINRATRQRFEQTFSELQQKFGDMFARLLPGGRAELILVDPEVDPDTGKPKDEEPGVDIVAQPPGKRLKSLALLSGGEKALTALALIFASFVIRPTPFCILDEIDASLDEENIGRFTAVLRELATDTQFLVVTHNKRTMAVADSLFGVTMEEPGVSKLVSVRLAEFQPA